MEVEIVNIATKETETLENVAEADLTSRDIDGRFEELVVEIIFEDETEKKYHNSFIYGANLTGPELEQKQRKMDLIE